MSSGGRGALGRMAVLALLWGSGFLWIKLALNNGLTPLQITFARSALGAAVLLGLAWSARQRVPRDRTTWCHLVVAAFFGNALPFFLFSLGEQTVDSGLAGVLNATTPLWSLLIGIGIGAERGLGPVRLGGLLLGFAGTLLIFAPWHAVGLLSWGTLALLGAAASYAVAFAYMARKLTGRGTAPIALAAAQLLAATALSALALPAGGTAPPEFNPKAVIAVALLGILSTGFTFYLSYRLIADEGATSAATVGYLLPVVSVALGAIVLDEQVGLRVIAGMVVVFLGVAMTRRQQPPPSVQQGCRDTRHPYRPHQQGHCRMTAVPRTPPPDERIMQPNSPWRNSDFRALFTATSLSQLGTNVGYIAVPLIAVSALDASPGQVGALATLSTAAFLLIGLPAGAWVDRMRHRRVLITADLARAALFALIPLAWWWDALTLWQLYLVVLLNGCATVFSDVGAQSVLPRVVGRDGLVQANAAVVSLIAVGNIAGRGAGGALVQLLSAPVAVACAAVGYLASALRLTAIRRTPASAVTGQATRLSTQIAEGLQHVFNNPELRALALTATLSNLGSQIINTMLPVLFIRELGLSAGALGLFWAVGGAGLLLGSRCARPIAGRLGYGRALGLVGLCLAPAGLLVPLIDRGPWLWLAGTGWLLALFKTGMDNVLGVSLRQRMTADFLLGRMNATFRFLLTGALAIGAAVAGLIGELASAHATLWVGGAVLTVAFLPVFLSPLRTRRDLPESPAGKDDDRADQRTGSLALAGANRPVAETPGLLQGPP